uniref:Uncharacterized protein n=1 Tax=Panagrolaimus davidi TaxID=227884 RepID=A0A914PKU1_9BILA
MAPMPAPVRIDEPTSMDISDDEDPRRRNRSRTYLSEDRYKTSSWRNIRSKRSRSRSPIRTKGGMRINNPKECEHRRYDEESKIFT